MGDPIAESEMLNRPKQRIPDFPYLPPSPQSVQDYPAWEAASKKLRMERLIACNKPGKEGEDARREELERVKDSIQNHACVYFLNTWGSIYNARPEEDDASGASGFFLPLILFPFQIEVLMWLDERLHDKEHGDGVEVKARQMGLSNITMFFVTGKWLVVRPFQARVMSRTEGEVDETGSPDALFWKAEMLLRGLPVWMLEGLMPHFKWGKHRLTLRLINPDNLNVIKGESTQANAGRGSAVTMIIYDEAAFIPNFGAVWTAGRAATRHRIALSTVSIDEGMDFYNLHHGTGGYTQPPVLMIPYNEYPGHDEAWLEAERARDTPEGIAREVLMDYFAGGGNWVYPESHEKAVGDYPFLPGAGPVFVTLDDGFDDDFAIIWIQYIQSTGRFRVFQGYSNHKLVTDFYGSLLIGQPESQFFSRYGSRERAIMSRQLQLPSMKYTADPHIENREQITGQSPMEYLAHKYGILTFSDFSERDHKKRRLKLGGLLPMMDFHDRDGGEEVLDAVQHYRFPTMKDSSQLTSEPRRPIHDKHSHFVTALEWFAVQWDAFKITATGAKKIKWSGSYNS